MLAEFGDDPTRFATAKARKNYAARVGDNRVEPRQVGIGQALNRAVDDAAGEPVHRSAVKMVGVLMDPAGLVPEVCGTSPLWLYVRITPVMGLP